MILRSAGTRNTQYHLKACRVHRWLPPMSTADRMVRAISRSACMESWATTYRAISCSPISSPRSDDGWPAKTLRCNRSPGVVEWSQRCAALAMHPMVVESRDFWLETATKADLRIGTDVPEAPRVSDLTRLSSALTVSQTSEVDDARRPDPASDRGDAACCAQPHLRGHGRRRQDRR